MPIKLVEPRMGASTLLLPPPIHRQPSQIYRSSAPSSSLPFAPFLGSPAAPPLHHDPPDFSRGTPISPCSSLLPASASTRSPKVPSLQ